MIEKFLSLFERFVVAVEAIAAAGGAAKDSVATPATDGPKPSRSRAAAAAKKDEGKEPAADSGFDFLGSSAKKYEKGDVKAALEKLVGKIGQPDAFKLFVDVGGVQSLNDLPESKYSAVIEAVEKQLQTK